MLSVELVIELLGWFCLFFLLLQFIYRLIRGFKGHFLSATVDFKKLGKWAVITGGTDGIGKAFAEELASKGLNICLLSKSPENLSKTATEFQTVYGVETKVVVAEFTENGIYTSIENELEGMDIGVLVNNVGMGVDYPDFFENTAFEDIRKMINANSLAVSMMTRIILPAMLKKHRGLIINISSGATVVPPALFALYAASKAFTNTFSEAISNECQGEGVIVQSVLPFFVSTKASKLEPSLAVLRPRAFARQSLKTVGHYQSTHGAIVHDIIGFFVPLVPKWLLTRISTPIALAARKFYLEKKRHEKSWNCE